MVETSDQTILEVLLIGMIGMFVLASAVVVFFIVYQNRLLSQQKKHQEIVAAYQKELLKAVINGQENERSRLAKDLHDEIGAMLTTIKLYTSQIDQVGPGEALKEIREKATGMLDETIRNTRRITHDLSPVILKKFGFTDALESIIKKINESGKIKVDVIQTDTVHLTYEKELALYRISQELINNTLKHAEASQITISLHAMPDHIQMIYEDDGIGFMVEDVRQISGLGLKNIESRLNLFDGKVSYLTANKGVKIKIDI